MATSCSVRARRTEREERESVLANTLSGTHTHKHTNHQMQMQPLFVVGPSALSLSLSLSGLLLLLLPAEAELRDCRTHTQTQVCAHIDKHAYNGSKCDSGRGRGASLSSIFFCACILLGKN